MTQIEERELSTEGKKPALVARLTEAVKQENEEIQVTKGKKTKKATETKEGNELSTGKRIKYWRKEKQRGEKVTEETKEGNEVSTRKRIDY